MVAAGCHRRGKPWGATAAPPLLCCSSARAGSEGLPGGEGLPGDAGLVPTRVSATLPGLAQARVLRDGVLGAGLQGQGGSTRPGENAASLQPSLALIKSLALT